jgi:hypothetical protein
MAAGEGTRWYGLFADVLLQLYFVIYFVRWFSDASIVCSIFISFQRIINESCFCQHY